MHGCSSPSSIELQQAEKFQQGGKSLDRVALRQPARQNRMLSVVVVP